MGIGLKKQGDSCCINLHRLQSTTLCLKASKQIVIQVFSAAMNILMSVLTKTVTLFVILESLVKSIQGHKCKESGALRKKWGQVYDIEILPKILACCWCKLSYIQILKKAEYSMRDNFLKQS